jgi:predicted transcriptional regulator
MSQESEKLALIRWLSELQDEDVLDLIKWIKTKHKEGNDWWENLSRAEKASIDEGLKAIANGEVYDHEEVKKRYQKWL